MFLGKEVIGNPIINRETGHQIGKVQDLYLDEHLHNIAGLYVGSDGLFSSTPKWIAAENVTAISQDTVLVKSDSIVTRELNEDSQPWVRRDDLQGRPVDTTGGTKIGRIGDVILDEQANIVGFSLGIVYVHGPIADRRALRRTAVRDLGHEDGSMTISLTIAEQQDLRVIDKIFFGQEVKEGEVEREAGKSPDTMPESRSP